MKALVIGATGATGKDLVEILLDDAGYTQVVIFVRRRSEVTHPKLLEILTDFSNLEQVSASINGDVWFSCLGTTLKAAGSKEKQWSIDYEIPAHFAGIAKRNGIPCAVLLSAYGASSKSRVFYSRLKGQLEEKIASLAFNSYIIFKPGLLLRKNSDRPTERLAAGILKFFNSLGIFKRFRPLPTATLAEKLAKAPGVFPNGKHIVALDGIFKF